MKGRFCIAIACAGLLAMPAGAARAQTTFRETGSVTVGGYVVWVRGTNASAVELFVGRGFRDAFAPAHEMDAVKLQHWIDSVRALAPLPADDSGALSASAKTSIPGGDVAMQRRVGGLFAGLRLMVNGEEPIQMAEPTARDFIAALDSATRVARELSGPAVQTVASVSTPAPVVAAPVVAAPVVAAPVVAAPVVAAPDTTVVAAIAPAPKVTTAPPTVIAPPTIAHAAAPLAPAPLAAAPLAASTSEPPPELVLPTPAAPVLLLASRVDIMPLPMAEVVPPARVAPRVDMMTVDTATVPAPRPAAAAPPPAAVAAVSPAPAAAPAVAPAVAPAPPPAVAAPVALAVAPAADTAVPPHPEPPADKLIHTPLGPFTIPAALLNDRDKEAQYCYTQLGLKYNPELKGEITVKLSLGPDGSVQDASVTKRSWQGISAGEVESCVRALAHDWTFAATDASVVSGAKLLTFSFAP